MLNAMGETVEATPEAHAEFMALMGVPLQEWPDPQPLMAKVPAEPYPIDALPDTIRHAVEEVAGFVKAPIPLVASSALSSISLAIQNHVDVKRAEKLSGPTGLFMLTIADSGERKSTCDGFFTKAIRDYEQQQAEMAKQPLKDYKADIEAWDAKRGGIKEKIRSFPKTTSLPKAWSWHCATWNTKSRSPHAFPVCSMPMQLPKHWRMGWQNSGLPVGWYRQKQALSSVRMAWVKIVS
ncbi:Protein of unknown function [Nitrosospira multiformis]|uniref:DUF3987 domain-containing protein n=1 Tax=Nitrosospira multiformis TaxID=1231 RepID=A0A1H8P5A5_9PROT|nr:Protein of unknown function [Nitrosospira multiformis]